MLLRSKQLFAMICLQSKARFFNKFIVLVSGEDLVPEQENEVEEEQKGTTGGEEQQGSGQWFQQIVD